MVPICSIFEVLLEVEIVNYNKNKGLKNHDRYVRIFRKRSVFYWKYHVITFFFRYFPIFLKRKAVHVYKRVYDPRGFKGSAV